MIAPVHSGHRLDHYFIGGVAARSGMASIFRAKDLHHCEDRSCDQNCAGRNQQDRCQHLRCAQPLLPLDIIERKGRAKGS